MPNTKIEWCNKTWSPVTGCSPISEGCAHCWAKRMANRLKGRYGYPKDEPFRVTFHPDRLKEPLHWKKSCRIFVCSMGDIAHEDVKEQWFENIMGMVSDCHQHLFLLLTKRPARLKKLLSGFWMCHNFWLGVSVEDQKTADERIPILLQIPATKRFVSVEPMLGPVDISKFLEEIKYEYKGECNKGPIWDGIIIQKINLIICGGETGPGARPLHPAWVRSLRDQCQAAGMPFFFKGMMIKRGYEKIPHKTRLLDGKIWDEFPKAIKESYGKHPKGPQFG